MSFETRLKDARKKSELTRKELAEKIGVTSSSISNYENGISMPKTEILYKILDALNVDANFLFQDEIDIQNRADRIVKKASDLGDKMKSRMELYEEETTAKEETCRIINLLDIENVRKAKDYVSVLYENMTFHDEKQITIDEVQADEGDKK